MKKTKRRKAGGRAFSTGHDARRHTLTPEERARGRKTWAKKNLYWGDIDRYLRECPLEAS